MIKKKLYLQIAGFLIELIFEQKKSLKIYPQPNNLKNQISNFLKDYIVKEKEVRGKTADFEINFSYKPPHAFILDKKKREDFYLHFFNFKKNRIDTYAFLSINQFNYILLRFVLSYLLNKVKGFFLHCSANLLDEKNGILFLGKSGAGKSTITRILRKARLYSVADDGVIVRKIQNNYLFFPLIFLEKKNWQNNCCTFKRNKGYMIKGLYFLVKDESNFTKKIHYTNMIERLFPLVYNIGYYDRKFFHLLDFASHLRRNLNTVALLHFDKKTNPSVLRKLIFS